MVWKKYFYASKKTFLGFFLLGIGVFALDMVLQHYWLDIAGLLTGQPRPAFDNQPRALRITQLILAYSPWIAQGIVLVLDALKKHFGRSLSYFLGMSLAYLCLVTYILYNWDMSGF